MIALLGPNGSGKTTLLKNISRTLEPKAGIVQLGEKNIKDYGIKELAKELAVIPQSFDTTFSFSVEEIVLMGRSPHLKKGKNESAYDLDIVHDAMKATNVWHLRNKLFMNISGGEKQRTIIARALAQEPEILLLDEPTSSLDINHQVEILSTIHSLSKEKDLTVIAAFHDLNLAAKYFDRIVILSEGHVRAIGTPNTVLSAELIKEVYGVDVIVQRHPLSESVYVLPLSKLNKCKKNSSFRAHIIAGGGSGTDILIRLSKEDVALSLGAINLLDSDYELAKTLDISDIVIESPFSPISEDALEKNMEYIEKANLIILSDFSVGHGNLPNLIAAQKAIELGKKVIIFERGDIKDRDYTGGIAKDVYDGLILRGAKVVDNIEDIVSLCV